MSNVLVCSSQPGVETRFQHAEDLKYLLETSPCACIAVDADGFVIHVNLAALDLLRYRSGELTGFPVSVIVPPEHAIELRLRVESRRHCDLGSDLPDPAAVVLRRDGTRISTMLGMELTRACGESVIILAMRDPGTVSESTVGVA